MDEIETFPVEGKKFGRRAGAYVIDLIVLYAANGAVGVIGGPVLRALLAPAGQRFVADAQAVQVANWIIGLVLITLYFTLFEGLFGASPGKLILGMRVIKADGRPCGLGAALVRALLRFVDGLIFGLPAYLSMKPPLRQRLGDKAAKTLVVGSQDAFIQTHRSWWWFLVAAALYCLLAIVTVYLAALAMAPTWTAVLAPLAWESSAPPCTNVGQTTTRPSDGAEMVCVPAGEFLMGSAESDLDAEDDEKPQHTVYLDAFWIDRTEVRSAQYRECVRAGACLGDSCSGVLDLDAAPRPVVCVGWDGATAYCQWAGTRLPTEAEWEKAARGTEGWIYPWGNNFDGTLVNFCDKNCEFAWKDTSVDDRSERALNVGMYPKGASPYGAVDMTGNVWELVSDSYSDRYYASSPTHNPQGPPGEWPVVRGGGWSSSARDVRAASRHGYSPPWVSEPGAENVGFRCAVSPGQ